MKKVVIVLLMAVLMIIILGCGFLPAKPPVERAGEEVAAPAEPPKQEKAEALSEPETAEVVEQVVEAVEEEAVEEAAEEGLKISNSLDLQSDLTLCPNLANSFECDKYDIRRCDFKTFVGDNDFYPDLMNCRKGYDDRDENPDNMYCLIQECRPLEEDNIVYAYGKIIAYAEYAYNVEKVEGGIMTHYGLLRCGEIHKEFESSFDCQVYKSELEGLWVN
jgi:hypothetical protein